ncbi:MAG: DNA internalization-related competence protein ComEC/Rec2 [Candidatus Limivicinus sp.]
MRKLMIAALSFSAAVFAANYFLPLSSLVPLAAAAALIAVLLLFIGRKWLRGFEISLFGLAFGFLIFFAHARCTAVPAESLDGETREINAVILDYPADYDKYCRAEIRLRGDDLPHLKAILYDNKHQLSNAEPGQTVRLTAKLKSADTRFGKEYDYYNSKNIYLTAGSKSDISLGEKIFCPESFPARVRHRLTGLIDSIYPKDTAGFMKSILLGDKSGLYEDKGLSTALSRAGLMHIAAVSGMHIAFLVSLLQLFLGNTGRSSVICMAVLWSFVLVTGASPSAVRAGFMQTMLLMAPLVHRENDPPTSLSAVLAMILLFNPYAASSVSLQLSFGAAAGILCFGGRIYTLIEKAAGREISSGFLKYPVGIISSSLSVMIFTVPLTAVHFGTVAVLSPLANVAALWAVSLSFCGGVISCLLGLIMPVLGTAAAALVSWPARYVFAVAKLVSKAPFAAVYVSSAPVLIWLIASYIAFIIVALSRKSPVFKLCCPAVISAVLLFITLTSTKAYYRSGDGRFAVLDVGQGQCITAMSRDSAIMVDCGGGGKPGNAGERAGAYLLSRGRNELSALVLTHLHRDHANGVETLLELVDVKLIVIPENPPDDDGLLQPILESAAGHGCPVMFIGEDQSINFGALGVELYAPGVKGDANERCIMCRLYLNDYDMLITADAAEPAEDELIENHDIHDVDVLIAGHHGSKFSCGEKLLGSIGADTAIISSGYNTYGHPTPETLERLNKYGYNVFRTDQDGTLEKRIG